ncbi:DUF6919 domain-containing protein [Actinospica robiniae]|uniref:DUF6919 domain-containing protein n=1 Tax=Actinospica robiniae TaxID=304901 RepID=UPI0003FBAAB0|nr:hypothetical protein [Actinospica robiniae]
MTTHQDLWQYARTLADLGDLTADWLEGGNSYLPAYLPSQDGKIRPADETVSLIPHLARANRNGFVTTSSQPGVALADCSGQRAFVGGFCTADTAERIQDACLGTDLIAIATPPAWENPTRIAVSIRDAKPCTWAGAVVSVVDIGVYYGEDCPRAVASLFLAWQVAIIDPAWGRARLLWERLDAAWK